MIDREIAEAIPCSRKAVSKWRRRHGLPSAWKVRPRPVDAGRFPDREQIKQRAREIREANLKQEPRRTGTPLSTLPRPSRMARVLCGGGRPWTDSEREALSAGGTSPSASVECGLL